MIKCGAGAHNYNVMANALDSVMKNLDYIALENMPGAADAVVGLIYDSWKPAIDTLFERPEAFQMIRHLMEKERSELSRKNISILCETGVVAGVTVSLDMAALKAAFQANLFTFMHMAKDRSSFLENFETYKAYPVPAADGGTYLSKFAVAPAYRARGLGQKLMECFVAAERKKKTPAIHLVVHKDNYAAISLYKKYSFIDTGADGSYMIMRKDMAY